MTPDLPPGSGGPGPTVPPRFRTLSERAVTRRERLETRAGEALADGDPEASLALLSAAAELGWLDHSGDLVSPRLEALVAAVGAAAGDWPRRSAARPRRTVLHVLTEAYAVGGHTRMAWRWIEQHPGVRHDVVLTQHSGPLPAQLVEAANATGGEVRRLSGTRVQRLLQLRRAAAGADAVVLHVHPFDVLAVCAVAHPQRDVPVLLVNHADHVFWVGATVVDRVVCLRPGGLEVARDRRGIAPDRLDVLPIPLPPVGAPAPRTGRRSLLTVGSHHKFVPFRGETLAVLVEALLSEDPAATFAAVGPRPGDPVWARVQHRFGDRVQLLGQAAVSTETYGQVSVYLDSYPVAGYTSWLDAAAAGVPVVSYRPPWLRGSLLVAQDVADALVRTPGGPAEWVADVRRLLDDPVGAAQRGQDLRREVLAAHRDGWSEAVVRLVEGAEVLPAAARELGAVRSGVDLTDAVISRGHRLTGLVRPGEAVLSSWSAVEALDVGEVLRAVEPREAAAHDLSVVLTVSGGREEVERGLATVETAFAACGRLELQVVAGDLRADGAVELEEATADERGAPEARFHRSGPGHPTRQLVEEALLRARAPWLVVLSDDVELSAEDVQDCVSHLLNGGGVRGVVPRLVDPRGAAVPHGTIGDVSAVCLFAHRERLLSGSVDGVVAAPRARATVHGSVPPGA